MRVEIAGALSSGKSTLSGVLAGRGHTVVLEDLTTNPYLNLRIEDPETYDPLCQRQFALDKVQQIDQMSASALPIVFADFSLAAERAYVSHYLAHRPEHIDSILEITEQAEKEYGFPALTVFLECRPEEQIRRIKKRGRDFEQGHDLAFVARINDLVRGEVERQERLGAVVVRYRSDVEDFEAIAADIERRLGILERDLAA